MIEFEGVSKTYPDGTAAVDGLDLRIDSGSLTVFVGPSGCGKTTSMRMINRMVEPTAGRILMDGQDTAQIPTVKLRQSMGYVLQGAGLFPHRTAIDNVATTLRLAGASKADARRRAGDALRLVRLRPELDDRFPSQLSGGQQQRVGVARALVADPPVLLMDEPFSAVDPVVRAELQGELLRLRGTLSQTIVFVTHDIDEALLLGDRIVVFGPGGTVHQCAEPQTILERPADAFVAQMVGRDRGFRALGFHVEDLPVLPLGDPGADGALEVPGGSWRLTVDDAGRPLTWENGVTRTPAGDGHAAGSSLRSALDAALSSPAGTAAVVDDAGRVVGWLQRSAVLTALEAPAGRP
ncbi:ABC transporter ATP-binding protein [Brevibacterium yomogidense]|uniref:ABC transporter ATP-binding protein n=1 Tax=Brevibacterium yomogidense TaxID=946573 RepID=UPI0018E052EF|nr:ABC transporter ATP-binding protein [Brevibacterium yomogidense]